MRNLAVSSRTANTQKKIDPEKKEEKKTIIKYSGKKLNSFYIYDRLRMKYEKDGYKYVDPVELSKKIKILLSEIPETDRILITEIIYLIILHHEKISTSIYREVAYDGEIRDGDVYINFNRMPVILQELLSIFVNEIISNQCPEQKRTAKEIQEKKLEESRKTEEKIERKRKKKIRKHQEK